MGITLEDTILITCSGYGTVCIWDISNIEGKTISLGKDFSYFREVLIGKGDLEEKLGIIRDLTQRTYELEMEHAYQMRHMETVYNEKITDIQVTYNQAIDELKAILESLEANFNTELYNISSDMNVMKEIHEGEMLEMEAKYNSELITEYNKVVNLEHLKIKLTNEYEHKLKDLKETKEQMIEELKRVNESKLYNMRKMVEEVNKRNLLVTVNLKAIEKQWFTNFLFTILVNSLGGCKDNKMQTFIRANIKFCFFFLNTQVMHLSSKFNNLFSSSNPH